MRDWGFEDKAGCVIFNELEKHGWLQLGIDNSALIKNNFIFVYHKGNINEQSSRAFDYSNLKSANRPILLNPSRCSWHIERFGWLIDKGQTPGAISNLFDVDWSDYPDSTRILNEFVKRIDDYALMSDIAIKPMKQRQATVLKQEIKRSIVESNQIIDKGSYFKIVNAGIPCNLDPNFVYYLSDYNANGFLISTMSIDLSGAMKKGEFIIDTNTFLSLVKQKYLYAVEIHEEFVDVPSLEWQGITDNQESFDFPNELKLFNVPKTKQAIVAQAFNKCFNITPFLNQNLDREGLNLLLGAAEELLPIYKFNSLSINTDTIKELIDLIRQGYCVDSLLNADYSGDYIKAIFNESFAELQNFSAKLKSEGFNSEQIKELMHIHFDAIGIDKYCNIQYSARAINMLFYCDCNPLLKPLCDLFITKAFDGNESLYVPSDFLDGKMKACIRNVLSVNEDLFFKDLPWNSFIDELMENLRFVHYYNNLGFVFRTNGLGVGVDTNSIFITEITNIPKWRATLINEKFYICKINEDQLSF